jgi:hypothetical protein
MIYKKLVRGEDIGAETGLIQSAYALDAAAVTAERQNDVEGMLNVAAMWMKFTDTIVNFHEHVETEKEGEMIKTAEAKIEIGFQRSPAEEPIVVEEEDE